jgi:glycosyltransferase involved in cell wall biosynthesis
VADDPRPKLLFITTDVPYPLDGGGKIKTHRFLQYLTKVADVKLICAYGGNRKADVEALRSSISLKGFQAFKRHLPRTPLNVIAAFLYAPTLNSYRLESKEITTMIQWSSRECDAVIVDHLEAYHLLPEEFKHTVIYHSHNAEFKLWEAFASTKSSIKRWLLKWEAARVKKFERWAISRSRFTFIAPNDQKAIQERIGFKDDAFRPTYHLGNDEWLDHPDVDLSTTEQRLFFAGTLDWEPNRDGLMWFLQSVWPLVIKRHPNCHLEVCGRNADQHLIQVLKHTQNVNYHGFVEDLEAVMIQCRAAVVPLRFGSGMKLKSFDALYRGIPLISTPIGVEGINIENKKHAFIVSTPDQFLESVTTVIENIHEATTIRNNGRALCRAEYTNQQLFNDMVSTILQEINPTVHVDE